MSLSRAFLYGESVFTTLRVENGIPRFASKHLERLQVGAEWVWPGTLPQVETLVSSLTCPGGSGVWRMTLHVNQNSRQLQLREVPDLSITENWNTGFPDGEIMAVPLPIPARPGFWPSTLKSGDYFTRLMISRTLRENELALFHVGDFVTEFVTGNFFGWDGKTFFTPPTGPDVLSGIGRARVVAWLKRCQVPFEERPIRLDECDKFKSMYFVNAVRGIVPVKSFSGRELDQHSIGMNFFDEED